MRFQIVDVKDLSITKKMNTQTLVYFEHFSLRMARNGLHYVRSFKFFFLLFREFDIDSTYDLNKN